MSGKVKEIIDEIIEERSKGNPAIREMTKAKLILKGLNPNKFNRYSYDDPKIIEKLRIIEKELIGRKVEDEKLNIKSIFSEENSEEDVVLDIKNKFKNFSADLIIFFSSSNFNQGKLSYLMKETFKDSTIVGCSTAGEMVSGQLLNNAVVAMAINSNVISDMKLEVIKEMDKGLNLEPAFRSFENYFKESLYTMDIAKYVGLVLIDGINKKQEEVMDLIGNRTNIFFVGGTAADEGKHVETHVCADGKAYTGATVLLMLKINDDAEFNIIKTQSVKVLENTLIANKVNEETREVIEFNNMPAVVAYADAVGADSIDDVKKYFKTNPVGLIVGDDDIYVRCPEKLNDTRMEFCCKILNGMEVTLLKTTDIIKDTKRAIENEISENGKIEGIVNFDCIYRIEKIKKNGRQKEYGGIFKDIPTIGFSTYGEEFIGHTNQTSTMLIFRSKKKDN
ncbi:MULTISPECIES: FIST N-terminal domain-containing protein [Clostridium]|uniref:FIST C-terminal domain-containing protein n=1 Tax=Clostridium cibarium TaxID=2762247 RepID=A0ABR8PS48_9CLOT|nr:MULTISPECIES: FIST N-terminal domain-containing protein [Clostridium]MBD7911009.1 FIST C-terminal domain-containing protein [Clostridium cibarium]